MRRKSVVLFPVLILFCINLLNFYDRTAPAALVEPMRKEFNLSDTQIGLLGSAFVWIYALVGVPLGFVSDRWSRKKLLAIGITLWTSLTALTVFASTFAFLLVARLGVGVGEAVCAPAGTSWIGDLFPAHRRSRALSVFMLAVPIGGALSYYLSGPLAQAWGWRAAMVAAAAPAVLLVPMLFLLHEPARGASEEKIVQAVPASTWSLLRIPTLWWIIASGVFFNFNMYALGTFMPAFLSRVHGYSLASSGMATGSMYLVGGVCGGLLGGQLGDRAAIRSRTARLRMGGLIALFSAPIAYFGIVQPSGSALAALLFLGLAYGAFNTYYGFVYPSIQDIVPPRQRGTAMAIYFMAMYLCGASFGPLLTGSLSDQMARRAMTAAGASTSTEAFRATGLQQAMLMIPILCIVLAIVLWAGSRTISKDIARRDGETAMAIAV